MLLVITMFIWQINVMLCYVMLCYVIKLGSGYENWGCGRDDMKLGSGYEVWV